MPPSTQSESVRRNLLFYIFPLAENSGVWRRSIRRLRKWISQFDGVRSVCVVNGDGLESIDEVRSEFGDERIDNWITGPNVPDLGEAAYFLKLLETVKDQRGITWYGHTKGVTHGPAKWTVQLWIETSFELTLSRPAEIHRYLIDQHHVFAGAYRKRSKPGDAPGSGRWHYSGTFFWFCNERVFARKWKRIEPHRWSVESWPSLVAALGESACIACDEPRDLYRGRHWSRRVLREVAEWRDSEFDRVPHATPVVCGTASKPQLHIVTAVTRPENLPLIQEYLTRRIHSFDVRWWCVADSKRVKERPAGIDCEWRESASIGCGGPQRNVALEEITDGMVWFCDDDNLPHPEFDDHLASAIKDHSDAAGFVFGQFAITCNRLRIAAPENVKLGSLDLAQYVLQRSAIGERRFDDSYVADWRLFGTVWHDHRDQIHFGPLATFHNALENSPQDVDPPHWHETLRMESLIGPLTGMKIVEPGSCTGRCTVGLAERGAMVTAIEPQEASFRKAALYCRQMGVEDCVQLIHGDATILEAMGTDQFDLLYHAGLLYHLESPVDHFCKVSRLCRRMFLDTHVADGRQAKHLGPMTEHEGLQGQWYVEPKEKGPWDGLGARSFWMTETSLYQLIDRCRLRIVETLKHEADHNGLGARVALLLERH